jgi:uncharacterized protein
MATILVARDAAQLKRLQQELEMKYGVTVIVATKDLSKSGSAKELHDTLRGEGVEILVNNAGVGLRGDFFSDDLADDQGMAYLNMNSLMDMTYYFGGDIVRGGTGKILNVASVVAFFPGPKQPIYYATKAFVRSFSRALAYNLRDTGVTVTVLHPGITKTNFFTQAKVAGIAGGASPTSVAQLGYNAMMAGKGEVTHGFWNKVLTNVFVRWVPYRLQAGIVDRAADA